jgi:hypothetical protein
MDLNEKVLKFKDLISSESNKKQKKIDELIPFKNEIKLARSEKMSFDKITDLLGKVDVKTSKDKVREFCIIHLKEKSRIYKKNKNNSNLDQNISG